MKKKNTSNNVCDILHLPNSWSHRQFVYAWVFCIHFENTHNDTHSININVNRRIEQSRKTRNKNTRRPEVPRNGKYIMHRTRYPHFFSVQASSRVLYTLVVSYPFVSNWRNESGYESEIEVFKRLNAVTNSVLHFINIHGSKNEFFK